ncbi:MAG: RNase adapter RapZ [Gammaproteobacteria bacterium]|nr:RNase adapter RapZ [Gammaproteobacteria bacterium]
MNTASFFIISGTSGSGKTVALQVLEDLGFYCIDNLPASLLPDLAARAVNTEGANKKYAVSIDSRNQDFIGGIEENFRSLQSSDIEYRIIFLDANDAALLKRYSETRRKHPLSDKRTSLAEAITRERELLAQIAAVAHHHVDTSKTTPHELRSLIRNYAATNREGLLTLLFQSFGFKYGSPRDADFVFDVRCLPNPHWDPELKSLTGLDPAVNEYLSGQPMCIEMYEKIRDFIEYWLPAFVNDNRNYITVAIGCTGGQHRSVFLCDMLSKHFGTSDLIQTQVRHRELNL